MKQYAIVFLMKQFSSTEYFGSLNKQSSAPNVNNRISKRHHKEQIKLQVLQNEDVNDE